MGSFSDFLELELLDHVFGNAAYTAPATVYVGLYTATPSDSGGGTEVSGGSYARVAVTNNATNWPAASAGAKANGTAFTFPSPTANWTRKSAAVPAKQRRSISMVIPLMVAPVGMVNP